MFVYCNPFLVRITSMSSCVNMLRCIKNIRISLYLNSNILILLIISILYSYSSAFGNEVRTIELVIENVIYETEEGYISTDKGEFELPNPSTEIAMDNTTFNLLIINLKRVIGKRSVLYVYDKTVVGVSSEADKINFIPGYKKRKKTVYKAQPSKIKTVLNRWESDTYMLSAKTSDGIFCVFNNYEVSDYYEKIYRKLREHGDMESSLNIKVTIFYHRIDDSYECQGEIEDIDFADVKHEKFEKNQRVK